MSSSPKPVATRRARPIIEGPTYMAPRYHSRLWGRLIFLVFILLLVGLIGGGGGLYWALHRAQGSSTQTFTFHVGTGDSVNTLANRLEKDGIVDNALLFKLDARIRSLSGKLKPGDYTLRRNMSIDDMVAAFSVFRQVYISVALPPGYRYQQMAPVLQRRGIDAKSFLQEVRQPNLKFLNASVLSDKPRGASLEGYLFPDTYDVVPHSSGAEFAKLMVHQMDVEFTPRMRADMRREGLTIYKTLIIASIVEREARVASERPIIASVYLNRLHMKPPMDLQADPTVQYAAGGPKNWWPILQDIARNVAPNSPYNTYTHHGLPPGPIASPQLASIRAVIYPKPTNYLYFVLKPHTGGHHAFAATYQEQLANQQKYQSGG